MVVATCLLVATSASAAPPAVSGVSGSNFTTSGFQVTGTVNPEGENTQYHFEYVTSEEFDVSGFAGAASPPVPPGSLLGNAPIAVSADLSSLPSNTAFHVRLVAVNGGGTTFGGESVFSTYAFAVPGLPEGRGYEQVSPVEKLGLNANGGRSLVQASTDGNAIAYYIEAGLPGSEGAQEFPNYLSSRGETAWTTRGLLPPASTGPLGKVLGWSEDHAYSVVANRLSPAPTDPFTLYVRDNGTGQLREITGGIIRTGGLALAGTAASGTTIAYEAKSPVTQAPSGLENKPNVYVWSGASGETKLASVLNSGLPPTFEGAFAGPYRWWGEVNLKNGGASDKFYAQAEHVLSDDGSSLLFTSSNEAQIYLRQNPLQPQSALAGGIPTAYGAASGTGTVTAGSNTVTSLLTAMSKGRITAGSPIAEKVKPTVGRFLVGQPIAPVAGKIPPGTTITAIQEVKPGEYTLTLSANAEGSSTSVEINSPGPRPFAVGQRISGIGIPLGTTITAVSEGTLTLSGNATESGAAVPLVGSTECTEPSKACTVQVSASERATPDPHGQKPAVFVAAIPDGSAAFFMSGSALTDNATTGPTSEGNDLYRYEPDKPVGDRLTDLAPDGVDANGAEVKGVLGISKDGSYVYFVAAGALPGTGAPASTCTGTGQLISGKCNLYVWHENQATHVTSIDFVAQLDEPVAGVGDNLNWSPRESGGGPSGNNPTLPTARVSETGALLFASSRSLTGYDNVGPSCHVSGGTLHLPGPCSEVYRYVPGAQSRLDCVSCSPVGMTPLEAASLTSIEALSIPTTKPITMTRNISADGNRVFFETPDKLVPADVNGEAGCPLVNVPGGNILVGRCQDVYEWVAPGSGACTPGGPAFSSANGGCIYLISTGNSTEPSFFGDNDESGGNAFFYTYERLVGQDKDELLDIYDARVGGGLPLQNPAAPSICTEADSCRGPATPALSTPAPVTEAFTGPGNQKPPRHVKKHKHHVKKHKKQKRVKHKGKGKGKHRNGAQRSDVRKAQTR